MEAPVPASALIHSATLVSAGVYLILRFKAIILLSEYASVILPVLGSITAMLGALTSTFQTDAKKLLAYSTISHCGFLVVSSVICDSEYTILYLYVHGFFKAAAFICIGNIIRFNYGYQDIRCMGGYNKFLPFESAALFACLLLLAGAPFSFGFYMKHFLVASLAYSGFLNKFIYISCFIAACFGVIYCSKLYYGIFFGNKKSNKFVYRTVYIKNFFFSDKNSFYYTNTTLGAIFSIFGLIFFGMLICAILIIIMYAKFCNEGDFGSTVFRITIFNIKYYTPLNILFNYGFMNIVMICIFVFLCIVSFV
jgi:NADH:ubiquinone oxidoreductase subunit 5 (subunit L)/multisubunit Na+/H+ antiporter MnhA subunit